MCTQILKQQQADLAIVQAENGSSMIKVEQVRGLERSLMLSPYEAKYRVALLLDFQQANANAQNALLKTLEEAPRKVILLLTADSAENLLPTISSRCEILRLRPIPVEKLEESLKTRWSLDAESARLYAHLAGGRVGTAVQYAEHPDTLESRKTQLDDLVRLLGGTRRERFAYTESLNRNRDNVKNTLQTWFTWLRDLLLLANGSDGRITNIDREAELKTLAGSVTAAETAGMVKAVDNALAALEVNANLRLLLDNFFLDLPRIA
jgi:DNA polymerase-3 subunit delta'